MSVRRWLTRGALAVVVVGLVATAAPAAGAAARLLGPGGGYGADFTGDGLPDILAREKGTGKLKVYPHSGTVDATFTYPTVVTINYGWGGMRWIGAMDLSGDGFADVVAIDQNWRMVVAVHSGHFNGTSTLTPGLQVIGYNWNVNNLVSVTSDSSLLARRAADGEIFAYQSNGLNGTDTFGAPTQPRTTQRERHDNDLFISAGMLGSDNGAFLFVGPTGELYAWNTFDGANQRRTLGEGWHTVDSYVLTDLNADGKEDLVARSRATGELWAYLHSGVNPWPQLGPGTEPVYPSRITIGFGWQTNDVIA
jgi:VCBS repeat protein